MACLKDYDEALVSQAYTVFKIIDHNELDPEYLMMWFRRSEFDRYARFKSHGGVREIFGWEEMCEVELPIPSIDKQREIVKEYNTIIDRIKLNEQLNQKLEETAQALYKHWFVDFEFPISAEQAASMGKPDLNGKPNKSSGGKMVWNEELEKEIPEGWESVGIGNVLKEKGYIRGPFGSALKVDDMQTIGIPVYEQQHVLDEHRRFRYHISVEKYQQLKRFSVEPLDVVISCSGVNLGKLSMIKNNDPKGIINQALLILRADDQKVPPIIIKRFLETDQGKAFLIQDAGGSAIPNIAKREIIQAIPFLRPSINDAIRLGSILTIIEESISLNRDSIEKLSDMKSLLLSKMTKVEDHVLRQAV